MQRRAKPSSSIAALELRLKDHVAQMTGFADVEVQARKLESNFRFFDRRNTGCIDLLDSFCNIFFVS